LWVWEAFSRSRVAILRGADFIGHVLRGCHTPWPDPAPGAARVAPPSRHRPSPDPIPEAQVLVMKLGAAALLVALAAVGVATVTDLITAAQAPGIAVRAAGAIAILTALGAALSGLLARRGTSSDTSQQRVP
jgi:hypothetical protein